MLSSWCPHASSMLSTWFHHGSFMLLSVSLHSMNLAEMKENRKKTGNLVHETGDFDKKNNSGLSQNVYPDRAKA
jgi:hypothetical protein